MSLPEFLLGDNTDFSDEVFIMHTTFPRFIINLSTDEVELFEEVSESEQEDLASEMELLVKRAYEFYDREVQRFEDSDE